ncbi:FHA domain-containing protein [Larkinella terrae]|uniref:FHA domain-containing protein n=1 Tax=Larkinella terrae TaxID=2025311 RepID=UPI00286EB2B3|nr:FHA domain-containing protein [Larkinella terrae]
MSLQVNQIEELIDGLSQLPTYTIGRKTDNAIIVLNGKISSQHARLIQCTDTSFVLEDLASKNGTFVNDLRITRKIVDKKDKIRLADIDYTLDQLLDQLPVDSTELQPLPAISPKTALPIEKPLLDFTQEFAELRQVFEQYPKLRRDCRNREKMIRTGSIIVSSLVGISAVVTTGGGALPFLQIMSGAGLSMLIPTLCSTLLSTDEKLELIDKEYRERYRCPNPSCRDPFGLREWEQLAQQKTCRRCQAIWIK